MCRREAWITSHILLRPYPDEIQQRLHRAIHAPHRNPLKLSVEILAAGKNVGAGESAIGKIRSVGPAADGLELSRHACPARGFHRIFGDKGDFVELELHVAV